MPPIPPRLLGAGSSSAHKSNGLGSRLGPAIVARAEAVQAPPPAATATAGPTVAHQWFHRVADVQIIDHQGSRAVAKTTAAVYGPLMVHPSVTGARMGNDGQWVISQVSTGLHLVAVMSKGEGRKVVEEMVRFAGAALAQPTKDATSKALPEWFYAYVKVVRDTGKFFPSAPCRLKKGVARG